MEILNTGGWELLVLVLLAIFLFEPEDMIKFGQTIGRYTQTARRMWAQAIDQFDLKSAFEETADLETAIQDTKTAVQDACEPLNEVQVTLEEIAKPSSSRRKQPGNTKRSEFITTPDAVTPRTEPPATSMAKPVANPSVASELIDGSSNMY